MFDNLIKIQGIPTVNVHKINDKYCSSELRNNED